MATAQAVKPSTASEVTLAQSLSLMKNVIRASIGEICFVRNLFPSGVFRECSFGGTTIHALAPRDQSSGEITNESAARLHSWLEAGLEAVEKGYLRSMVLGIYSAEDDPAKRELLESYVFNFRYPSEQDVEASLRLDERAFTLPSVREDAVVMVRTLLTLLNTMKKLTLRRVISIKLFYNEDVTPAEYQPTFYADSTDDNHAFFAAPPLKLTVGKLASRHHSMTLKAAFREDIGEEEADVVDGAEVGMPAVEVVEEVPHGAPASDDAATTAAMGGAGTGVVRPARVEQAPAAGTELTAEAEKLTASASAAPPQRSTRLAASDSAGAGIASSSRVVTASMLPDGIDVAAYRTARELVVERSINTLKGLLSALAEAAEGRRSIEVTGEQGRRIMRQLEVEGILRSKAGGRYELVSNAAAVAAAVPPAVPAASDELTADTTTPAKEPVAAPPAAPATARSYASAAATSRPTVTAPGVITPARWATFDPVHEARLLRARAIIHLAALRTERKAGAAAAAEAGPATHVSIKRLAELLEVDADLAKRLVTQVAKKHVIAETADTGKGFPIYRSSAEAAAAIKEACTFLQTHGHWDDAIEKRLQANGCTSGLGVEGAAATAAAAAVPANVSGGKRKRAEMTADEPSASIVQPVLAPAATDSVKAPAAPAPASVRRIAPATTAPVRALAPATAPPAAKKPRIEPAAVASAWKPGGVRTAFGQANKWKTTSAWE